MKRIIPQKDGLYAITLNNLGYITPTDERFYMEDNMDDNLITGESIDKFFFNRASTYKWIVIQF